jgi:hypothetical protein
MSLTDMDLLCYRDHALPKKTFGRALALHGHLIAAYGVFGPETGSSREMHSMSLLPLREACRNQNAGIFNHLKRREFAGPEDNKGVYCASVFTFFS